jgi:multimeric flavodoxin WrbA
MFHYRRFVLKITGICGSQNKNGNTAFALNYALDIARKENCETEYITVAGKNINNCTGCWSCAETGKCIFDDDMYAIEQSLRNCDGMIFASPVYFGMVSSQLKTVMERCVVLRPSYNHPYIMTGKVGGGIACGGFRNGGQELTLQNISTFIMQINAMAVSDGPGFSHSGAAITGDAKDDEVGLQTVKNLTLNIINSIKSNRQSFI